MNNKIKISLVLTLLIISSIFYPVSAFKTKSNPLSPSPVNGIEVIKEIWDPGIEDWVDYYEAEKDETVTFRITITYRQTCPDGEYLTDIEVVDTLPDDLIYGSSSPYEESWIDNNKVYWNLSADYEIILGVNESISIEFTASVDEYGEHVNFVEVSGFEICCHVDLYGDDCATVNVEAPPYLEFDKYVYDPDSQEWVEVLESVIKGQVVDFKIDVTFSWHEEIELIKFMVVEDYLHHCGLEYDVGSELFEYPSEDFEDPEITVIGNHVIYNWTEKEFNLFQGETVTIKFSSTVVEYCGLVENWAFVDMWNCSQAPDPIHLTDSDNAFVNTTAPPPTFDKWVWNIDSEEWVELIDVYLDEDVTFKIELTYYGNDNLTNISVVDQLPCALEFIEGSGNPEATEFSEDKKTIWWNISDPLEDGELLKIEFEAKVIDDSCGDSGINTAIVNAYELEEPYVDTDTAGIFVLKNTPPCRPDIKGDTFGEPGQELTFRAIGEDPDGDDIFYRFKWGDDTQTDWIGPVGSGDAVEQTHIWETEGVYQVSAQLKDFPHNETSPPSYYPIEVTIEEKEKSLDARLKLGFQRGISFTIENTGEADVKNITWTITITRRGIIKRELLNKQETISSLGIGNEVTIKELPKFCFWPVEVKLTVESDEIDDTIEVNAKGFMMFRFIRLRRFLN